jgi:hypothetical protein
MKSLNRKRFTRQGIERLRYDKVAAPPSGRIEIEDEACPGLPLRVTSRNVKSFSVIYRVLGEGGTSPKGRLLAGKQHRVTLGVTPPLELTAARRQACDIIQAATEGRDLRTERREKNLIRSVNTFEAVLRRFMEIEIIPNVEAWKNVDGVLRRHVLPHWANTDHLRLSRARACGQSHKLWGRSALDLSSSRIFRGQNTERCEACRPACRIPCWSAAGSQPSDRKSSRRHVTAITPRPSRRSNRIGCSLLRCMSPEVARLRHATGSVGCPFPGKGRK